MLPCNLKGALFELYCTVSIQWSNSTTERHTYMSAHTSPGWLQVACLGGHQSRRNSPLTGLQCSPQTVSRISSVTISLMWDTVRTCAEWKINNGTLGYWMQWKSEAGECCIESPCCVDMHAHPPVQHHQNHALSKLVVEISTPMADHSPICFSLSCFVNNSRSRCQTLSALSHTHTHT